MLTDRRTFLRTTVTLPLAFAITGVLPACQEANADTPKPIKYGRDACEHCTMLISDAHFAAEVWNPDRKQFSLFDDIGCAIAYAVENRLIDRPEARIWAADYDDPKQWLDARKAFYRRDVRTPMDYGFAATRDSTGDRVDFNTMRAGVIRKAHCAPRDLPQDS